MKPTTESLPIDLRCKVCAQVYNQPIVFACGHSVCIDCLAECVVERKHGDFKDKRPEPDKAESVEVSYKCPHCSHTQSPKPPLNHALQSITKRHHAVADVQLYRNCTICIQKRADDDILPTFSVIWRKVVEVFSKKQRLKDLTSERLHEMHVAGDRHISTVLQKNQTSFVDVVDKIEMECHIRNRDSFDKIFEKLENCKHDEMINFMVSDGKLASAKNEQLVGRIAECLSEQSDQLKETTTDLLFNVRKTTVAKRKGTL